MPKDRIDNLEFRWGNDHFDCVQVGVVLGKYRFVDDDGEPNSEVFTGMFQTLYTEQEIDKAINTLRRMKRKTFPKNV